MGVSHKLYVPAGNWLVASLTSFCQTRKIGNATFTGIGSITNVWVLLDPNGTPVVTAVGAVWVGWKSMVRVASACVLRR